jgi:hypothetical protein
MAGRIWCARHFVFLRRILHELFAGAFQDERATVFRDDPKGQPSVLPAQLALVILL